MIHSMTGYASRQGEAAGYRWSWELRSVNGKGLDLRMRVPDWIEGLEAGLRPLISKSAMRGNVSLSLRVSREETQGQLQLNEPVMNAILNAMAETEARAMDQGVSLAPSTAAEIVAMRGVLEQASDTDDTSALKTALLNDVKPLIAAFIDMRAQEGAALEAVLRRQLDEISDLTDASSGLLVTRQSDMAETLRRNLAKVMDGVADVDDARVAQELALLTVKSDVTEEIDRLKAHSDAAVALLGDGGPVGRKLDFLCQEFNREANTLCSKAQMPALTEKGLALKVVIDQMREQIQNVE